MRTYYIDDESFVIQFNRILCETETNVLNSKPFIMILRRYMHYIKTSKNSDYEWILEFSPYELQTIYKILLLWPFEEVSKQFDIFKDERHRYTLYLFTEDFYDYWRKLERYGFFTRSRQDDDQSINLRMINHSDTFSNLILRLYRTITQNILGRNYNLLRQLPAGVLANISLVTNTWTFDTPYTKLPEQAFVSTILTRPPLMIYSRQNTRTGLFHEYDTNPLTDIDLNKNDYIVIPIKVGRFLCYVYMHRKFLKYAITLGSLFELASFDEFKDKKPDLIFIYGIKEHEYDHLYHYDKVHDIHIGFVSIHDKNDYFGYVKKMILTLHNVRMIHKGYLPIHGAMFKIHFKNGLTKNVVLVGDSGAGKSETIEALNQLGKENISHIKIMYDDMGTFFLEHDSIYSQGTEIGAFVRLDDLDQGYAYRQIDRAVFLNPHRTNARVVLPASYYEFVMRKHRIDLLLYANNYDNREEGLKIFDSLDEAISVFEKGERLAKGTTSEVGMTETFFANPFGPLQHQNETKKLIDKYFNHLYQNNIPIGMLYTRLGIKGFEQKGPKHAASKLLEYLLK
ncbi:hypothetical protein [Acholeplasma equifetale]|uniref:hypothetical protein n=1 Tax=Acholeplasma equifetale TaxID=264634 RepID=UPI00047C905C|nr:hypothetical protein [Acholeplasma equifetale]